MNDATFEEPLVPVLLQILSGAKKASDLVPAGSIYKLGRNKSVELTIPSGVLGGPVSVQSTTEVANVRAGIAHPRAFNQHPIHLHEHAFHVVRSAGNSTYNFDNPAVRDVVSIGESGDNVTIRFYTDNPGPWFLHCHIDWHFLL